MKKNPEKEIIIDCKDFNAFLKIYINHIVESKKERIERLVEINAPLIMIEIEKKFLHEIDKEKINKKFLKQLSKLEIFGETRIVSCIRKIGLQGNFYFHFTLYNETIVYFVKGIYGMYFKFPYKEKTYF